MKRFHTLLLLAVLAGGLYGAGRLNGELLALRRVYGISQADPLVNAPPLVTFTTVALGGFRGILADILWLRSSRLQEEGRYFELVQLADWITKLEPRFSSIWAFHAWNLAYNVSVLFQNPEDRWRWVRHGLTLLRDEGLRYNPGDARLLYELGWIFQHKLGGSMDDAHRYYKQAWAQEMASLFDGPQPDYGTLALAAAGEGDEATLARFRRLRDEYKMDPARMEEADRQYGPLDWRLPQAHALYWGLQCRRLARDFDAVQADRMIFQAMADAFRQGRLFVNRERGVFLPSPNLDLIPRVQRAFEEALAQHPDQPSMRTAHANFLGEAILTLYTYNRTDEARQWFEELQRRYPGVETAQGFLPYVLRRYASNVRELSDRDALAAVEGALFQALYWQALGEPDRAAGFERLGRMVWESYMAPRQENEAFRERTGLPPLSEIRALARERVGELLGGL